MRRDAPIRGEEPRGRGRRRLLWVVVLLALALGALVTLRAGGRPAVEIRPAVAALGKATPVVFAAAEPARGLVRVTAELVQGDDVRLLHEASFSPRPPWAFWGERQARVQLELPVGSEHVEGLTSGEATLRLSAWPARTWLRRPGPAVAERTLPVKLSPPSVQVISTFHYVGQGGSEVVVYRVGEGAVRDGVQAGEAFFPGRPLPGADPQRRLALFAVPWDLADQSRIRLIAEDEVENRAEVAFVDRFTPKPPATDTIRLDDRFLAKVVPEILGQTPGLEDRGDLLANYLQINGELRQRNAGELVELARRSPDGFYWTEPFLQMPNSQVMSAFADRRTYVYGDETVDQQTHLGFDLATVERDPVPAANRGKVVLARFFGIYGNAVVIDHGGGLMSLYGHLSSIAVEEGQMVERGALLGHTGATGLAGGDHLHFTMLVDGVAVTPVEWWDDHWIEDRIRRKLEGMWPTAQAIGTPGSPR
ncbi:MAG: M23 family metallopeptidase [Thermoanaerobaculia bacterium]